MKAKNVLNLITAMSICGCILSGCGEKSSQENINSNADNSISQNNDNNEEKKEYNPNRVEYGETKIYESSNVKISLNAIELGHIRRYYYETDPYDGVKFELFVENLNSDILRYRSQVVYVNGFEVHTDIYKDINIELSGGSKSITEFAITKDKLEQAGITQIENIKLKDYSMDFAYNERLEKLENAQITLNPPYEFKWN